MTFEPRELCGQDRVLLNEMRAHFQEKYERGVELWNKQARLRFKSDKEKQAECAFTQGNYEGLKYAADMLLHVLGQKKHEPLAPPAPAIPDQSLQDNVG